MTKPREWPNKARWARDGAADDLQTIVRLSRTLLGKDDIVVIATAGRILDRATNALRMLERVGAGTMPDYSLPPRNDGG